MINRRRFLVSSAIWFVGTTSLTHASLIRDHMPWSPFPLSAPEFERPGPWQFFTADEASAMEAIVDRIIPPDPDSPGGKGCRLRHLYRSPAKRPLRLRSRSLPARALYKRHEGAGACNRRPLPSFIAKALAALDGKYCKANRGREILRPVLRRKQQDNTLKGLESGEIKLDGDQRAGLLRRVIEGCA